MKYTFFCLAIAFMSIGPFLNQGLGLNIPYIRNWAMFSGNSRNVCKVKYILDINGNKSIIDRYKLYNYTPYWKAPINFRLIRNSELAKQLGIKLCQNFSDNNKIYMHGKCEKYPHGWVDFANGEVDLCSRN